MPWLQWYLKLESAQCFFSAFQHFKNDDVERLIQLSKSTNAQEKTALPNIAITDDGCE